MMMNELTVSSIEDVQHRAWLFAVEVTIDRIYVDHGAPPAEPDYLVWLDGLTPTLRAYARATYAKEIAYQGS